MQEAAFLTVWLLVSVTQNQLQLRLYDACKFTYNKFLHDITHNVAPARRGWWHTAPYLSGVACADIAELLQKQDYIVSTKREQWAWKMRVCTRAFSSAFTRVWERLLAPFSELGQFAVEPTTPRSGCSCSSWERGRPFCWSRMFIRQTPLNRLQWAANPVAR